MKQLLYILMFLWVFQLKAQEKILFDTIYVSSNMNVALVFPNNIVKGITGHPDFIFSYDIEGRSRLSLIKAVSPGVTNLVVQTQKEKIYNFILKFSSSINQLTYCINEEQNVLRIDMEDENQKILEEETNTSEIGVVPYTNISKQLIRSIKGQLKAKTRNGVKLALKGLYYHKNEVFIITEIENLSRIAYEVGSLDFILVHGNRSRNSSFQRDILKKKFSYRMPGRIAPGEKIKTVSVVPKFTLSKLHRLTVVLTEDQGTRSISLTNVK